jgi:hypothetical protein
VIIYGNEQEFPAGAARSVTPVAGNAMAQAFDTPELLGIDVHPIAWMLMLITYHRLARLEIAPARQTTTTPGTDVLAGTTCVRRAHRFA